MNVRLRVYQVLLFKFRRHLCKGSIGPLHDPVTWYKITYTGEQVAQWDFQNKDRCIVLEVPLCNLLTSICYFVPCDRVVPIPKSMSAPRIISIQECTVHNTFFYRNVITVRCISTLKTAKRCILILVSKIL